MGLDKEGKLVTGFYAARTHAIIPVEDCLLGVEENKDVLMAVKELDAAKADSGLR